jgi:hypothetical protein
MIFEVITWAMVALGACSIFFFLFLLVYQPRQHTLEDLPEFLQPLDIDGLRNLLDPVYECNLRQNLIKAEFKEINDKGIGYIFSICAKC